MAMGKRRQRQEALFVMADGLPKSAGHPFYRKLNALLAEAEFDRWIERRCQRYYEQEEQRGIAWRGAQPGADPAQAIRGGKAQDLVDLAALPQFLLASCLTHLARWRQCLRPDRPSSVHATAA